MWNYEPQTINLERFDLSHSMYESPALDQHVLRVSLIHAALILGTDVR